MTRTPETAAGLPQPWLTTKELAARWRRSPRTLERWRAEGRGPAWVTLCGRVLYLRQSVLGFERAALRSGGGR